MGTRFLSYATFIIMSPAAKAVTISATVDETG